MTMTRNMTLAAVLIAGALLAQGPDPLIYAGTQATYAHRLFDQCEYDQALDWMNRAVRQLREFRSARPLDRDTAGALLTRLEIERAELRRRRKLFDQAARDLQGLLAAGWVETVRSRLNELNPPACDARFRDLERRAEARAAHAAALVRSGDESLRQLQADRARKLYLQAREINRQHAGLEERLARARAMKPPGRGAAVVGKAILTTVVVAGIGYAGYWIYRTEKERGANRTPAADVRFLPPPTYRTAEGPR